MSKPLVSEKLWAVVAPLLPKERPKPKGGRPRISDRAALAVLSLGCAVLSLGCALLCWQALNR